MGAFANLGEFNVNIPVLKNQNYGLLIIFRLRYLFKEWKFTDFWTNS